MFQRLLNTAGKSPHSPPPTAPAANMAASSAQWFHPVQNRAKKLANTPPIISCPSPPMFQNRILKARVTPSAQMHSGTVYFTVA